MPKHVHKYQKVLQGKNKRIIYKCMKPDCTHYKTPEMIVNAIGECPRCGKSFVITKDMVRTGKEMLKPHCPDCVRGQPKPVAEVTKPKVEVSDNAVEKLLANLGIGKSE